jgi:outer membrane protein OmpA-like peptidoglycan-associated protein
MSMNLLDSLSGVFNSDLISKAASSLGESEGSISKVVSAGIPTLLSGMMSTSSSDGGSNLLNLAKQAAGSGILDNVGGLFGGSSSGSLLSSGAGLLSGLFGSKVGGLTSLISNFAGVKQSSVGSILSAVAPVALGFIGKHAISNGLSGSGILSWLTGQKSQITSALPAGLNLAGIFNGGTPKAADTVRHATTYSEPEKTANRWLWPIIIGLLALGLLWYFLKGCNKDVATPVVTDTVAVTTPAILDTAVSNVIATVRESFKVTLPDGVELNAFKGGIEDSLVTFLNNSNSKAGNDVWFDFDNLNFETGSAKITAESQVQVNNIASILKAYPKVEIKIGGYTDVTGDAAANKKLSQDRATAVVVALKAAGSNPAQLLGAEGYGSQFAKAAANASDDEKKKDRRIAISVRKK